MINARTSRATVPSIAMGRRIRYLSVALISLGLFIGGCSEVAPTNPFDPKAPDSVQVRASITGVLSAAFEGFDWSANTEIRLISAVGQWTESPSEDGGFRFDNVRYGLYQLEVYSPGHSEFRRALSIADAAIELGTLVLAPSLEVNGTGPVLSGTVRLSDRAASGGDHSGISIHGFLSNADQVVGVTQTDFYGRFTLPAVPADYQLRIRKNGFEEKVISVKWVEANGRFEQFDTDFDEQVIQLIATPLNGDIEVKLTVAPDWLPVLERYTRMVILQQDGEYQTVVERLTEDGIRVTGMPSGRFLLQFERSGFGTYRQFVELSTSQRSATVDVAMSLETLANTEIALHGLTLDACQLREGGVNFVGADFSGVRLIGNFAALGPEDTTCPNCQGSNSCGAFDFSATRFVEAEFVSSGPARASFGVPTGRDGHGASFRRADLFGVQMSEIDMRRVDLSNANLFGARASGTDFTGALLDGANLSVADVSYARFAETTGQRHPDVYEVILDEEEGPSVLPHPWAGQRIPTEPFRRRNPCLTTPDGVASLNGTNLSQANLLGAFLVGVDLSSVGLSDAHLRGADLRGVCLRDAALSLVDFSRAMLDGADLIGARMSNSILYQSKMRGVNLTDGNLTSSVIEQADFGAFPFVPEDPTCEIIPSWDAYSPGGECAVLDMDAPAFCFCRTRAKGLNLNGANLVGARFERADLSQATLLGVTVGSANERPIAKPVDCEQGLVDSCIDLGSLLFALFELPQGDDDEVFLDQWRQACVDRDNRDQLPPHPVRDSLFRSMTPERMACLYEFQLLRLQCEIDFEPCRALIPDANTVDEFIERSYRLCIESSMEAIDALALPQAPVVCNFASIQETWRLEEAGEVCDPDMDVRPLSCCPPHRISRTCEVARTSFYDTRLDSASLPGLQFHNAILTSANLASADLSQTELSRSTLTNVSMENAVLHRVRVDNTNVKNADLSGSVWTDAHVQSSSWDGVNVGAANLQGARFENVTLNSFQAIAGNGAPLPATFRRAQLIGRETNLFERLTILYPRLPFSVFTESEWRNHSLFGGDLRGADFDQSTFTNVTIVGADSSDNERPSLLDSALFRGALLTNSRISNLSMDHADFSFSRWVSRDDGTPGRQSRFSNISARITQFVETQFLDVTVADVDFAAADLARASFIGGSLNHVTFHGANLEGSTFENVRFFSTDFSRANLQGARLADLDLLLVTNLHLSGGDSIDLSNSRVCECVVDAMGDRFLGQPNVVMCGADLCP